MNRTVDRVPSRAETDRLRELREGQLATAASQAHAEPTLFTAAVAAALVRGNQPPRLEQISNQLHHRGRTGTTSEQTRRPRPTCNRISRTGCRTTWCCSLMISCPPVDRSTPGWGDPDQRNLELSYLRNGTYAFDALTIRLFADAWARWATEQNQPLEPLARYVSQLNLLKTSPGNDLQRTFGDINSEIKRYRGVGDRSWTAASAPIREALRE